MATGSNSVAEMLAMPVAALVDDLAALWEGEIQESWNDTSWQPPGGVTSKTWQFTTVDPVVGSGTESGV